MLKYGFFLEMVAETKFDAFFLYKSFKDLLISLIFRNGEVTSRSIIISNLQLNFFLTLLGNV